MSLVQELLESDVVDTVDVARVLGTSPRSVVRWQADQATPRRENEERLLELKAVLDLARRALPDEQTRRWLRTPVPALDYEKPLDIVQRGEWRRVIDTLLAFAEGVTD